MWPRATLSRCEPKLCCVYMSMDWRERHTSLSSAISKQSSGAWVISTTRSDAGSGQNSRGCHETCTGHCNRGTWGSAHAQHHGGAGCCSSASRRSAPCRTRNRARGSRRSTSECYTSRVQTTSQGGKFRRWTRHGSCGSECGSRRRSSCCTRSIRPTSPSGR